MKIDLHIHSKYSVDGEYPPARLIEMAKDKGLAIVSLTDHDTMIGVKEMMEAGARAGIKVVPGIELTGQIEGNFTHILGLNVNPDSAYFANHLGDFEEKDRIATRKLVRLFKSELNMDFDIAEMERRCDEAMYPLVALVDELLTNPKYQDLEIVQPYINNGPRSDIPAANFFWDHCCVGGRFYISYEIPSYAELISDIHKEGGIAIVAHPYDIYFKKPEILQLVVEAGVDGLEVFSNYHNQEMREWFHKYALDHKLLVSGGSDYHGSFKPHVFLGEFGCPNQEEMLRDIVARLS